MSAFVRRLAALGALAATGCTPGGSTAAHPSPTAAATATSLPVHVVSKGVGAQSVQFSEQKHDRIAYTLRADRQTADRDPSGDGTTRFVNPHVHFIAADKKSLFAESPAGTVTEHANVVTVLMSGRVHAKTDDGTTLESDTLRYDDADQTVHARGNVILTTKEERLLGGSLDADLRLEHVHLSPGNA